MQSLRHEQDMLASRIIESCVTPIHSPGSSPQMVNGPLEMRVRQELERDYRVGGRE